MKPVVYWRLDEFYGPHAKDISGHHRDAVYEQANTFYLEGPNSAAFCKDGQKNRAPHFVGGRLRAQLEDLGEHYSISLWLWNGMPNDGRDVSGWFISRDHDNGLSSDGDHLGIGGKSGHTGQLIFQHGNDTLSIIAGKTEIPRWTWQHVIFVRDGNTVRAYLNGQLELEAKASSASSIEQLFIAGRSDNDSNWEGRIDEVAVFDRALTPTDITYLNLK
jgi:Concanavalin A-like lectin/glucanases superfamily